MKIWFVDNDDKMLELQNKKFTEMNKRYGIDYEILCSKICLIQEDSNIIRIEEGETNFINKLIGVLEKNKTKIELVIDFYLNKNDNTNGATAKGLINLIFQNEVIRRAFDNNTLIITLITKFCNNLDLNLGEQINEKIFLFRIPVEFGKELKLNEEESSSTINYLGNYIYDKYKNKIIKGKRKYEDLEELCFSNKSLDNYCAQILTRLIIESNDEIWRLK